MKFNSKQEVFDYVARFLIKQGEPSMDNGGCAYRIEKGNKKKVLKCAVGCVIPKKVYLPKMEGRGLYGLIQNFKPILPPELLKFEAIFSSLQNAHDQASNNFEMDKDKSAFMNNLMTNLRGVAQSHKLNQKALAWKS